MRIGHAGHPAHRVMGKGGAAEAILPLRQEVAQVVSVGSRRVVRVGDALQLAAGRVVVNDGLVVAVGPGGEPAVVGVYAPASASPETPTSSCYLIGLSYPAPLKRKNRLI